MLSTLIGSVADAYEVSNLAAEYQKAREESRTDDAERLGKQLDDAFAKAKGDVFKILREAQSYAFEKATLAKGAAERFAGQLKAYRAAPEIYVRDQRLAVLEDALAGIRKYVVVTDSNNSEVVIVNLEESLTPDLYKIGGLQENKPQ
jgi:regulator of protease activity HflC (stomatin/prohibitin superfamily)